MFDLLKRVETSRKASLVTLLMVVFGALVGIYIIALALVMSLTGDKEMAALFIEFGIKIAGIVGSAFSASGIGYAITQSISDTSPNYRPVRMDGDIVERDNGGYIAPTN